MEHRDIHIKMDFSLKELQQIRDFLEFTNKYAGAFYNVEENSEMEKVIKYITEYFQPFLSEFVNSVEKQQGE
jgi:hypothetical protein